MSAQGEPEDGWRPVRARTLLTLLVRRRRSPAETRDHEALQALAEEAMDRLVAAVSTLEDQAAASLAASNTEAA